MFDQSGFHGGVVGKQSLPTVNQALDLGACLLISGLSLVLPLKL